MPIYEFMCNRCGKGFERLLLSGEKDERQTCEACGSDDTCRVLSTFSCGSSGSSGLGGGAGSSCSAPSGGFS
ncbi:MAG: zinc ribbon domain-containing protein [Deltaproteobacteria bacterium]|nr:zinc ribbon domain-containing protein [Deltaproteobacteria bacterium]